MSLQKIQEELKAPKNQFNNFGKYKYRNLEDILEAVKPLLSKYKYSMTIDDTVMDIAGRVYVKATATIYNDKNAIVATSHAFAREAETKKGMDEAQITGAASSYARKYCCNGLFLIDDTKDADSMDNNAKPAQKKTVTKKITKADLPPEDRAKVEMVEEVMAEEKYPRPWTFDTAERCIDQFEHTAHADNWNKKHGPDVVEDLSAEDMEKIKKHFHGVRRSLKMVQK